MTISMKAFRERLSAFSSVFVLWVLLIVPWHGNLRADQFLFVKDGNTSSPYYNFIVDNNPVDISTYHFQRGETYVFMAWGVSPNHPFMIGEANGDMNSTDVFHYPAANGGTPVPLTYTNGNLAITIPSNYSGDLVYFSTTDSSVHYYLSIVDPPGGNYQSSGGGYQSGGGGYQSPGSSYQPVYDLNASHLTNLSVQVNQSLAGKYSFFNRTNSSGSSEIRLELMEVATGQWQPQGISSSLYYVAKPDPFPSIPHIYDYLTSINLSPVNGYKPPGVNYQSPGSGYQSDGEGYQSGGSGYQSGGSGNNSPVYETNQTLIVDQPTSNTGIPSAATGSDWYQSFTAENSAKLIKFAFVTNGSFSATADVKIREGEGITGNILHSGTWTGIGSNTNAFNEYAINNEVLLTSGQKYTIQLENQTTGGYLGSNTSLYAGGMFYFSGYGGEYGDLKMKIWALLEASSGNGYQSGGSGYQSGGSGYQSGGSGYQSDGSGYQSGGSGYQSDGSGYQSGGSGYQSGGSGYQSGGSGYQSGGSGYQSGGSGYQSDGSGYQSGGSGYQSDGSGYQSGGSGYQSDGSGYQSGGSGYQSGGSGYQSDGSGYQSGGSGYQSGGSGYQSGGSGYQSGGSGYQSGGSGYQSDGSGYQSGGSGYQSGGSGYQSGGSGYQSGGSGYQSDGSGYQSQGNGYQSPGNGYQSPGNGYQSPGSGYQSPGNGYQSPGSGYQSPGNGYQSPGNGYQSPGNGYQSPGNGYQSPGNDYQRPENGYQSPANGYQSGGSGYQSPGLGYHMSYVRTVGHQIIQSAVILTGELLDQNKSTGHPIEVGFLVSPSMRMYPNDPLIQKVSAERKNSGTFSSSFQPDSHQVLYFRAYAQSMDRTTLGNIRKISIEGNLNEQNQTPHQKALSVLTADSVEENGGWLRNTWFGLYKNFNNGWVYHSIHGWLYLVSDNFNGIWAWSETRGWVWSNKEVYPFLYQSNIGNWIYLLPTKNGEARYYNYSTNLIEKAFP
jgi:hypothetical protein